MSRRHRSRAIADQVIALSVSYQRAHLLARGLGLEHLRELLMRLARPLVRQGASLAYGGHWRETEDNFTYDLLRLTSSEQEDNSFGGADTDLKIGRIINHSAWPNYLEVSADIEARWINCCRIIRVKQNDVGIPEAHVVADADAKNGSDRTLFNAAVTLSGMRRLTVTGMSIPIPDVGTETVPPPVARVILGGKVIGYSGFLPGIFEEALLTLEAKSPLYVLGGFGGASEVLSRALLGTGRLPEFTQEWHQERTPEVAKLASLSAQFNLPPQVRTTTASLDALHACILPARGNLSAALKTGLSEPETHELLQIRDVGRAVQLVRKGLAAQLGLQSLPA